MQLFSMNRSNKVKMSEVKLLKKGDKVVHTRYGESKVVELKWSFASLFGIVICPDTEKGKILLAADSGTIISNFLEGRIRCIKTASQKNTVETGKQKSSNKA